MTRIEDHITAGEGTLWGQAGGQLEFMGLHMIWKEINGKWQPFATLQFTDHDLEALPDTALGIRQTYTLEFPVFPREAT